jgi:precorrin-2 dehydrogenase/sirohydrochlorin ferrochelatase
VVGGGGVGARKAETLLSCGARVTVVSLEFAPELAPLAEKGALTLREGRYRAEDLDGVFLVIATTDDENLNHQVSRDAQARGILVNVADRPAACTFILPSLVRRGDLVLAISTSGKSPAMAKRMGKELSRQFGPEYGALLTLMGAVRARLLARKHAPEEHKPLFEELLDGGLLDMVRQGDEEAADALLARVLGDGFRVRDLAPDLGKKDTIRE